MPAEWRNTKKRDAEPSEMVSVRVPSSLKSATQAIVEKPENNSSLAAAVRWGLEQFNETFGGKGKKPALFD